MSGIRVERGGCGSGGGLLVGNGNDGDVYDDEMVDRCDLWDQGSVYVDTRCCMLD